MMEVYKKAEKLGVDIVAEAYNILIFTMNCDEDFSGQRENIPRGRQSHWNFWKNFFAGHSSAMLFRSNIFSYGVLLKGQRESIEENTRECVEKIRKILSRQDGKKGMVPCSWSVCGASESDTRRAITRHQEPFRRDICMLKIFFTMMRWKYGASSGQADTEDNAYLKKVDVNALNPAILQKFLSNGLQEETENFVKDYFYAIGQEPMESLVFRNYVILNVRFSVLFHSLKGWDVIQNEWNLQIQKKYLQRVERIWKVQLLMRKK